MPDNDSNWAKLCNAIEHPELIEDAQFLTLEDRKERSPEAVAILDGIFGEKPLADWGPILDANDVIYAPVREMLDALSDPQVELNDMLRTLVHSEHGPYQVLNTPIHLEDTDIGPKSPSPELGQHTEEVLLEIGYSWDDITRMQDSGTIPGG
jgi:crotonobetainyl-CoA:carnitine CoA-transferase CaiB-like acyl-CoA transferase